MTKLLYLITLPIIFVCGSSFFNKTEKENIDGGLVGYWKLKGDCLDYSGNNNNGVNHGVDLINGAFNGQSSYIEVPDHETLNFDTEDFTINVWVYTEEIVNDVLGDILSKYDPFSRTGITFTINSGGGGGYQSIGNDKNVYFGIDNAQGDKDWIDCGRPGPGSNYVSNSLTVFKGKLYAAVGNAIDEKDWAHVFRYEGGKEWTDLGRVGDAKTTGVFPMIVHNDNLYVATSTYDWTRVIPGIIKYDPGRVYRFEDINCWTDFGQPGNNETLNCMASYNGKLFIGGGPRRKDLAVYTQMENSDKKWTPSKIFDKNGQESCFPHPMMVYNNKLYVGFPNIFSFNGDNWVFEGDPVMTDDTKGSPQVHSLAVFRGSLLAGTWPEGKVTKFIGDKKWESIGRVGVDGTEVLDLTVYNGKLYGASLPRAEVCRYDDKEEWTSIKRFYDPQGWTPVPPKYDGENAENKRNEWSRVTSMTVYNGKLFISTGNNTTSPDDAPTDGFRGKVFCMEAGKNVSFDQNIGSGWKQITAVRRNGYLELFVDGKMVKKSSGFNNKNFNLNNNMSLKIGFGETDYFNGKISELRLYNRALSYSEINELFKKYSDAMFK